LSINQFKASVIAANSLGQRIGRAIAAESPAQPSRRNALIFPNIKQLKNLQHLLLPPVDQNGSQLSKCH